MPAAGVPFAVYLTSYLGNLHLHLTFLLSSHSYPSTPLSLSLSLSPSLSLSFFQPVCIPGPWLLNPGTYLIHTSRLPLLPTLPTLLT